MIEIEEEGPACARDSPCMRRRPSCSVCRVLKRIARGAREISLKGSYFENQHQFKESIPVFPFMFQALVR